MYEFIIVALFVLLSIAVSAFHIWTETRHPSAAATEVYSWWYMPM